MHVVWLNLLAASASPGLVSKIDLPGHKQPRRSQSAAGSLALDRLNEALDRLDQPCTSAVYASLLQQCTKAQAIAEGRRLHLHIVAGGYENDRFLGNLLVQMYGKCGRLEDACSVFEKIHRRNVFSWNIMMSAYAHNGHLQDARRMFDKMPERDTVSWNEMIAAYARNGYLQEAREVFDRMPQPDVVSWTVIVSAYAENGHFMEALVLFRLMDFEGIQADKVIIVIILDGCASLTALEEGKLIHSCILESGFRLDLVIRTTLVHMYGKCGSVEDGRRVFNECPELEETTEASVMLWNALIAAYAQNGHLHVARTMFNKMPKRDVVSWNTMIAAYAQNGQAERAMETFRSMDLEGVKPNEVTCISIIDACAKVADLQQAEFIHSTVAECGLQPGVKIGNALVNMYGKCGSIERAETVFAQMPNRNVVSWSGIMSAYGQNHLGKQALKMYKRMNLEGVKPNQVTFVSAIDACAAVAAPADAKLLNANVEESGVEIDLTLGNAIVDMYGKCGNLQEAASLFNKMPRQNVVTWNTMIGAYAQFGHTEEAIHLFQSMALEGTQPNEVCFTSVLTACNHSGLLDEGWSYFISMIPDHGLGPLTEHYHCMINLLGRAGRLAEVEDLIYHMPFKPDVVAWTALLDACRTQGDLDRADRVAEHMFGLDPANSAPYTLLSNMYASQDLQKLILDSSLQYEVTQGAT